MYSGTYYSDVSPRIGVYAVGKMLAYAQSRLVLEPYAMVTPLPKNKGQTIKWRRPVPFAVDTTALLEGVTPNPEIMQYEDVSAQILEFGGWVPITDWILDTHEDPVLNDIVQLLGKKAADTKEAIIWGIVRAGSSVVYSGAATSRATVDSPLSGDELDIVIRTLKANHAEPVTRMLSPSPNFGTEAVNGGFIAVGHSNMEQDIRKLDGFVPKERYGSFKPLSDWELGKVNDIRFILTPHLEPFPGAGSATITGVLSTNSRVDVYPLIVFGQDAYGVTALKGMDSAQVTVTNPSMGKTETDPLGQRGFAAWKFWYVAKILNDLWIIRVEAAVSSL
jgi:N4-gp56 family major capsid protein